MKTLFIVFLLLTVLALPVSAIEVGKTYHITGCDETGWLACPVVNMWSHPGTPPQSTVVGKLSGDGRADKGLKCQGSVVKILDVIEYEGRTRVKIESVVNRKVGWVTDFFIGRRVK